MSESDIVNTLVQVASHCDRIGLHKLANQIDEALHAKVSNIDAILQMYQKLHVVANDNQALRRVLVAGLRASDRPDTPKCPFGLPIPLACKFAGESVEEMSTRPVEHEHNKRIYNKSRTSKPCPFALQVLDKQKAVHCSFGTINAGQQHWTEYSSSPYYPKLWQAFNLPDPLVHSDNYYSYNDTNYTSSY